MYGFCIGRGNENRKMNMNTSECELVSNCELIEQTAFESLVKKSITANINHISKAALEAYGFI